MKCEGCKHRNMCFELMGGLPDVVGTCYEPETKRENLFDFLRFPDSTSPYSVRSVKGTILEELELA